SSRRTPQVLVPSSADSDTKPSSPRLCRMLRQTRELLPNWYLGAGPGAGGSGVQVAARAGGHLGEEPRADPDRALVDDQVRAVQVVGAPTRGAHAEAGHRPDGGGQVPAEVLPAEGLLGEHQRIRSEHRPGSLVQDPGAVLVVVHRW